MNIKGPKKNESINRYAEFKRDILNGMSNRDLIRKYNKKSRLQFNKYVSKLYKDITGVDKNFSIVEARIIIRVLQTEYKQEDL